MSAARYYGESFDETPSHNRSTPYRGSDQRGSSFQPDFYDAHLNAQWNHEGARSPQTKPRSGRPTVVAEDEQTRFGGGSTNNRSPQNLGRRPESSVARGSSSIAPPPPPPTAVPCLRATYICSVLLCLLGPSLLTAGIIMMVEPDPREAQLGQLSAADAAYQPITVYLLNSKASLDLSAGGLSQATPTPTSNPAAQNNAPSSVIELTPSYEILPYGDTIRSVVLQSKERVIIPENVGPNQGSLTFKIVFQGVNSYEVSSPVIVLRKEAARAAYCTPQYATICGTTTCCAEAEMSKYCEATIKAEMPSTTVAFVKDVQHCALGERCGECRYNQMITKLCFLIRWGSTGWRSDEERTCTFPFLARDQEYGDSDKGAILQLRAASDPFVTLQEITQGTGNLVDNNDRTKSNGRGLMLFGVIVLLLCVCIVVLSWCCGMNLLSAVALDSAFGIKLGKKAVRRDAEAYERNQDRALLDEAASRVGSTTDGRRTEQQTMLRTPREEGMHMQQSPRAARNDDSYIPPPRSGGGYRHRAWSDDDL